MDHIYLSAKGGNTMDYDMKALVAFNLEILLFSSIICWILILRFIIRLIAIEIFCSHWNYYGVAEVQCCFEENLINSSNQINFAFMH